jgi:2-phospho-L-lactate guanylyltransferase
MRAVLLPVKDLRQAKKRLASLLTAQERFELAHAMLRDVTRALSAVTRADKIFVVTNYEPAIQIAEQHGWEVLREEEQVSESFSVDAASSICAERGVDALLRLPLDVPLVCSTDIDELLALDYVPPAVVIIPSRDGTGTNAILRTPPALFRSHFGPSSFAKHCAEAHQKNAAIIARRNARLEMDVDDEADLLELMQHDLRGTETGLWLHQNGVPERLQSRQPELTQRAAGA